VSAPKDLVIPIRVGETRGQFTAATELAGTPICTYGATEAEAVQRARGATLRLLANIVEKGNAEFEAVRFRTIPV
jgi:hypothetical protein